MLDKKYKVYYKDSGHPRRTSAVDYDDAKDTANYLLTQSDVSDVEIREYWIHSFESMERTKNVYAWEHLPPEVLDELCSEYQKVQELPGKHGITEAVKRCKDLFAEHFVSLNRHNASVIIYLQPVGGWSNKE